MPKYNNSNTINDDKNNYRNEVMSSTVRTTPAVTQTL